MAYGLDKNSPKYQPCLKCGKGAKRTKQTPTMATYYCAKCGVETIISL